MSIVPCISGFGCLTVHPDYDVATSKGSVLLAAIAMLTKVLQKMSQAEMLSVQDACIPGIIKAYKHPMAEVRKGVVFAMVEMYLTIGKTFVFGVFLLLCVFRLLRAGGIGTQLLWP